MTGVDNCGAATTTGEPCRNPAGENGRCWIPSHNDPDAQNPGGRPSKFDDERARAAIEAAREGLSRAGCERAAGVGDGTLANWLDQNPTFTGADGQEREFFRAFRRARREGESTLIRDGLRDADTDSSMAKFLLSTSFDYVKTERREHEHSGDLEVRSEVIEITEDTIDEA